MYAERLRPDRVCAIIRRKLDSQNYYRTWSDSEKHAHNGIIDSILLYSNSLETGWRFAKCPAYYKEQYACALRASVLPIYSPLGNSEILSWLICLRPAISRYSVRVCPAHHGDANSMSRPPDRMRTTPGKCWRRSKDLKAPREKAQMDRINNWLYLSLNAINNLRVYIQYKIYSSLLTHSQPLT